MATSAPLLLAAAKCEAGRGGGERQQNLRNVWQRARFLLSGLQQQRTAAWLGAAGTFVRANEGDDTTQNGVDSGCEVTHSAVYYKKKK